MQYEHSVCQLPHSRTGDSPQKSTPEVGPQRSPKTVETTLVRGDAQEIAHTESRRTGPRRWLRAVAWLIGSGLHRRANATTQRVAEDLTSRMDYDTGHALYDLDGTARRLGVHRSTVKHHVRYLRELGALVWVSHGTQHNSRRARGLDGYAGTATIYAATIPPSYDHAMGHTILGTGYTARILIDQRGQQPASSTPKPVDNSPVDNPGSEDRAPLSLTVVKEVGQVEVEGGSKDTSRKRATSPTASTSPSTKTNNTSSKPRAARRSPTQVARDIWIARQVRPRVNWTQPENLRRLAFALRPLIDRGLDADAISVELCSWWLDWRPAKPASFIRAQLARQAAQGRMASAPQVMTDAEWDAYREQRVAEQQALEEQRAAEAQAERAERTDEDRRIAREYGWQDMFEVARHYDDDPEDALDLYGLNLCSRAAGLTASAHFSQGAFA